MTKSKSLPSLIAVIDIGTHKTVGLVGQVIDGKARMPVSYTHLTLPTT
jgi:cell division ATPase FtsA